MCIVVDILLPYSLFEDGDVSASLTMFTMNLDMDGV